MGNATFSRCDRVYCMALDEIMLFFLQSAKITFLFGLFRFRLIYYFSIFVALNFRDIKRLYYIN